MITRHFNNYSGKALGFILLTLMMLMPAGLSADEPRYAIQTSVLHLGEVVASPVVVVEEGRTARIHSGDSPQYTMAFLVQKSDGENVSLSFDFHSGNISIQPNVEVPLNETYQLVEDRVTIELFINRLEDQGEPELAEDQG